MAKKLKKEMKTKQQKRKDKQRLNKFTFFNIEDKKLIDYWCQKKKMLRKKHIARKKNKRKIKHIERYGVKKERCQETPLDPPIKRKELFKLTSATMDMENESTRVEDKENKQDNQKDNDEIKKIVHERVKKENEKERILNKIETFRKVLNKKNKLTNATMESEPAKDEIYESNQDNQKDGKKIEEIVHERVEKEQEMERSLNKIKTDQIKLNKQIHAARIEYNFLYNKVPLEEVSILPENFNEKQKERAKMQRETVSDWLDAAIKALRKEQDKVAKIMEKLAYDHIQTIKEEYTKLNQEFSSEIQTKKLKIFIEKDSYYGGNNYMDELGGISPIDLKETIVKNGSALSSTLPDNMKTETDYELLEKLTPNDIWLTCRHGRRTLNFLRQLLTNSRRYHLNYFYDGTYTNLTTCWVTIGLLNSNIKYLYEIKSGFSDGSTKIIIPKK